jgi:hypothetical protein
MLKVRGTDVQTATIHLDLVGYGESSLVRGSYTIIPGKAGRETRTLIKDIYRFRLDGYVKGAGEDRDERAQSWRVQTDVLLALMDLSLDPGTVEVGPADPAQFPAASPYLGLTENRILNARCLSMLGGPVQHHMSFQGWSFEMECTDSPPEWQDAGSP